jgi:hypothetical protein
MMMRCSECWANYLLVGRPAKTYVCDCGGGLMRDELLPGCYRVEVSCRDVVTEEVAPIERDQGYGDSHGNPASHAGPTGPADAPGPTLRRPTTPS